MNTPQLLLTLFGCGLVTYLTRMPTLVFAGKWKIPEKARRFMSYIGPSILTALIVRRFSSPTRASTPIR